MPLQWRNQFWQSLEKMPESDARSVECPYNDVTNSGRVWRKVPESDARSVECPYSDVTNSGRVWRKVPESDARSVSLSDVPVDTEPTFVGSSEIAGDTEPAVDRANCGVVRDVHLLCGTCNVPRVFVLNSRPSDTSPINLFSACH